MCIGPLAIPVALSLQMKLLPRIGFWEDGRIINSDRSKSFICPMPMFCEVAIRCVIGNGTRSSTIFFLSGMTTWIWFRVGSLRQPPVARAADEGSDWEEAAVTATDACR